FDLDRVEAPKQLAERVGVSEHIIRTLIRNGDLEHLKICRAYASGTIASRLERARARKNTVKIPGGIPANTTSCTRVANVKITNSPAVIALLTRLRRSGEPIKRRS